MSYGYVYVLDSLGANPNQAVKCLAEAEAQRTIPDHRIRPCELHGIAKGGMNHCQDEMKKAVKVVTEPLLLRPKFKKAGRKESIHINI